MNETIENEKLLQAVEDHYRADEDVCIEALLSYAQTGGVGRSRAVARATRWISSARRNHVPSNDITEILTAYDMSGDEGASLLYLAEALLRVPDKATIDALIRDKLGDVPWDKMREAEVPYSQSLAGRALSWTGKLIGLHVQQTKSPTALLGKLVTRVGRPVIRESIKKITERLAHRFVTQETIEEALNETQATATEGTRFSYGILGESARTSTDANHAFETYTHAIAKIGEHQRQHKFKRQQGLSIKLSALHPRYETAQKQRVFDELVPRLITLCEQAASYDVHLMIDAEESNRLFLSLEVATKLLTTAQLGEWNGLGFTVQAYEKRSLAVIDFFANLAATHHRKLGLRLVKGAYWDTEIKRAQEQGWDDFPVYTRKASTDISYLACAKKLLIKSDWLHPYFATHNALTIASILELAPDPSRLEFQRLQGMGEELHTLMKDEGLACGVYAPVGNHAVLLSYLVRRFMEYGANSSFVNNLFDANVSIEDLTQDPFEEIQKATQKRHPHIRRGPDLFAPERKNASSLDLHDPYILRNLLDEIEEFNKKDYSAVPLINGEKFGPADHVGEIKNPATGNVVGEVLTATQVHIEQAFIAAEKSFRIWSQTPVEERAGYLEKLANLLEENRTELMSLLIREAGKTIPEALAEVRESVDLCRYYAMRARQLFVPHVFPGPTGEHNELHLTGRGTFICISPWNFPLAIFLGQAVAALVSGNTVIAKPAPQTPLIAAFATQLMFDAGIPEEVFHLLPGQADVGMKLVQQSRPAGVAFTGSIKSAHAINKALAHRAGPIIPLIAETGGQNILIVDSSALPEQVVDDVIASTFQAAGQRCSALRILCLPEATADRTLELLKGAIAELSVGDPGQIKTDMGPIIDETSQKRLLEHVLLLEQDARCIARLELERSCADGIFIEPQAWEIPSIRWLQAEVFGPILHVVRYKPENLDALLTEANEMEFALSGGVHTRIESVRRHVEQILQVGNFYANKALIGGKVGVHPFGGEGNAGSGPKSGGPNYLLHFATERVFSTNLTAAGGNVSLVGLDS